MIVGLPGVPGTIPGVSEVWIPPMAAEWFVMAHDKVFLLAPALIVSLTFVAFYTADEARSHEILAGAFWATLLLISNNFIFGAIMYTGHRAMMFVVDPAVITEFNHNWQQAANMPPGAGPPENAPWYFYFAVSFSFSPLSIGPSIARDVIYAFGSVLFFISIRLSTSLWRFFVEMNYLLGPLCLAFFALPGWGREVAANWVRTTVTLSVWQVWHGISAYAIQHADTVLWGQTYSQAAAGDVHAGISVYDMLLLCLGSSVMIWLGPSILMIYWGSRAAHLYMRHTSQTVSNISAATQATVSHTAGAVKKVMSL